MAEAEANLDRYDLAILDALSENARITVTELSERVGLSRRPGPSSDTGPCSTTRGSAGGTSLSCR
jgi:hypothetical protein